MVASLVATVDWINVSVDCTFFNSHTLQLRGLMKFLIVMQASHAQLLKKSGSPPLDIHHTTMLFFISASNEASFLSFPTMVFITFKAQDSFNDVSFVIHLGAKCAESMKTLFTLSHTSQACWFITVLAMV